VKRTIQKKVLNELSKQVLPGKVQPKHLQQFMLELGKGFAFIGSQYRITLGNNPYRIDLVFYHGVPNSATAQFFHFPKTTVNLPETCLKNQKNKQWTSLRPPFLQTCNNESKILRSRP
jgi:hypothetical protein